MIQKKSYYIDIGGIILCAPHESTVLIYEKSSFYMILNMVVIC